MEAQDPEDPVTGFGGAEYSYDLYMKLLAAYRSKDIGQRMEALDTEEFLREITVLPRPH